MARNVRNLWNTELVIKFVKIKEMKIKSILALLPALLFLNCKDAKTEQQPAAAKIFKVTLDVIAKQEDDFCLLYTTDGTSVFKDNGIWQHVKGSADQQDIVFNLPENVKPTELRIDVGFNKKQEEIIIKEITFEYNGKKKECKGEEMRVFFRPDESKCTFDGTTGVIKALVANGEKQVPSLYPQEAYLGPELKKLVN